MPPFSQSEKHIYEEGELEENSTGRKFRQVRKTELSCVPFDASIIARSEIRSLFGEMRPERTEPPFRPKSFATTHIAQGAAGFRRMEKYATVPVRQEAEQRSPEAEKAHYLAWGAFYIIREKMMEESRRENKGLEVETEIRKWVKKAIDALKESDQWFGVEGYMEKVQKNEMYRFWLQSLEDCGKL